jgi:hypothetical protein
MLPLHAPQIFALAPKIATVRWLDSLQLFDKIIYTLNEKSAKAGPKLLKNSLLFCLFSGNSGITVGAAADGPVGRLHSLALPGCK